MGLHFWVSGVLGCVQYCDLGPLDRAIAQGRFRGDLASIYLCLLDIAAGMTYLHSLGIVHRCMPACTLLRCKPCTARCAPSLWSSVPQKRGAHYICISSSQIGLFRSLHQSRRCLEAATVLLIFKPCRASFHPPKRVQTLGKP